MFKLSQEILFLIYITLTPSVDSYKFIKVEDLVQELYKKFLQSLTIYGLFKYSNAGSIRMIKILISINFFLTSHKNGGNC